MRAAGVETRHALFQELGVLGPGVFLNAGPFLRVRRSSTELTNADLMVRFPFCSAQVAGLEQASWLLYLEHYAGTDARALNCATYPPCFTWKHGGHLVSWALWLCIPEAGRLRTE